MEKQLLREVRILKWYALVLTGICFVCLFASFRKQAGKERFSEIDVERINIVEKDGRLKMVISNEEKQHPGMVDGKNMPARKRSAGMIFFNAKGDECGGLVYDATREEAGLALSVDQYKNDQVLQLQYSQDLQQPGAPRSYGMKLWDRKDAYPLSWQLRLLDSLNGLHNAAVKDSVIRQLAGEGAFGVERLFNGKQKNGEVGLFIRDSIGRLRIKIDVGKNNQPEILFFDENGQPQPPFFGK